MTKLIINLNKSVEGNASLYFERAKKIKKKIRGAEEALENSRKKLLELQKKAEKEKNKLEKKEKIRGKREWYEKFRWFFSSEGFLVMGGRDATSNEIVVKKHAQMGDLIFHTDMAGSPFFMIKSDNKKIGEATINEAADATCTFSRAWKLGLQAASVFYVKPDQVSKKTKAGEYMGKGAFMIYGRVNYVENRVNLAVGVDDKNRIAAGPVEAIKKNCKKYVELVQGNEKPSDVAKYIQRIIGGILDEIIRALPSGYFKVKK